MDASHHLDAAHRVSGRRQGVVVTVVVVAIGVSAPWRVD